nr:hypothetical protein [Edaphobacter aggregans]
MKPKTFLFPGLVDGWRADVPITDKMYGSHLAWPHRKVLDAIVRCRTQALGGHLDQGLRCGHHRVPRRAPYLGAEPPASVVASRCGRFGADAVAFGWA